MIPSVPLLSVLIKAAPTVANSKKERRRSPPTPGFTRVGAAMCAGTVFLRALKVTEYESGRGLVEMELVVAVYVRLQLQNMTDESRHDTILQSEKHERPLKKAVVHAWSKFTNFFQPNSASARGRGVVSRS